MEGIQKFINYTGFANITPGHLIMICVGLIFIYLAIKKEYEPLLLIPIGFGIIIGNIPFIENIVEISLNVVCLCFRFVYGTFC